MINVMMGKCVGGSSVLTGGVCFRTPETVLETWRTKRGLPMFTEGHLAPFFEEVERAVNVEEVPESLRSRSTQLFHAGTRRVGGPLVTAGGRVLTACAHGPTLAEARARARALAESITWQGRHYRSDITAGAPPQDRP